MAHFCEHVTFKGTERRSALQVINTLERVGGELNAFTSKEHTVYYSAILRDHFVKAADLLTDIVFRSRYPQSEIDKEIQVICDEIESYNDSPAELIYDEFENIVFSGHPLGRSILGRADSLRSYTTTDALRFVRRNYRPDNAVFFAYGDIGFDRLVTLLDKATADVTVSPDMTADKLRRNVTGLPEYMPRDVAMERPTHQAHVMIGNRAYSFSDERRTALYLLNNILGGPGMNARLNLALRERHGLVYTVESAMVSYSDTGLWSIYFGCDLHDVSRCLRLVRRELDRLTEQPLTATQLAVAKRQIKGQIAIACDNRESFAIDMGKVMLHCGKAKDVAALFNRIDALTSDELLTVAREIFDSDRLTTLKICRS